MPNFGRFGFGTSETPIFSRPGIFGSGRFDGLQTWALNFTLLAPRQSRPHGNCINTGRTLTVAPPSRSRLSDRRIGPFRTVGPAPQRRTSDGAPFSVPVSPSRCLHLVQRRSIEPARRRGSRPVAWPRGGRRARAAPRLARSERRACGRGGADASSLARFSHERRSETQEWIVKAHSLGSAAISKFQGRSLRAKSRSLHGRWQSTSGRFLDYARNDGP